MHVVLGTLAHDEMLAPPRAVPFSLRLCHCPQMTHAPSLQVCNAPEILAFAVGSLRASVERLKHELGLRRREFRAVLAEVEGISRCQEDWECLDIGGTRFHAGRDVLGGRGKHLFSTLVSEEFPSERGSDGSVFIDRDPEHFALVLQYLREGQVHVPVREGQVHVSVQWKALLREFRYYGVQEFSREKYCLMILPRDGSAAHVYDSVRWQRLPSLPSSNRPFLATMCPLCWCGRRTVLLLVGSGKYRIDVLDPVLWTWNTLSTFEDLELWARYRLATAGSQLFCYPMVTPSAVRVYQPDGQWDMLPRMTEARRCTYAVCAMGDGIAAIGGMCANTGQVLCTVERFSVNKKQWERLPDMPRARCLSGATMWQGKLIVVGGYGGYDGVPLSFVDVYDPDTAAWHAMPPLPEACGCPTVVVYDGRLIVFGGVRFFRPDADPDEVAEYDADAQVWKVIHRVRGLGAVVPVPQWLWMC